MKSTEEAVLETLRQVQRFLDDNGVTLEAVNHSGARHSLDETVAQMGTHAVAQVGGRRTSKGETAKQRQLRLTLRFDHMRPIAVIAGQKLREQPEFTDLRLAPRGFKGAKLTAAARDMANAAEKFTDLFVQLGLAPDFVAQLRAAADRLDESIDVRGQSRSQRAGATEGLKAETQRARAVIRLLDSLVRPKLGINDELLREWQVVKHIQRARTQVSATSPAQPSPAAPPSAAPAPTAVTSGSPAPTATAPASPAPTAAGA